jgi:EpsI family protein
MTIDRFLDWLLYPIGSPPPELELRSFAHLLTRLAISLGVAMLEIILFPWDGSTLSTILTVAFVAMVLDVVLVSTLVTASVVTRLPVARLVVLAALLGIGLGGIYLVPRQTKLQPCRVKMELPTFLGSWSGKDAAVTVAEHSMLASDTQFCRKVYSDGLGDSVLVSIVLSGHDLDNSIHRPERCLPAQGWNIQDSSSLFVPIPQAPGGGVPVTRLHDVRQEKLGGNVVNVYNLNYYWFIGYSDITASHLRREYIDMRDRLVYGYNQRWAYVTVAATITKNLAPGGRDETQTDAMIQELIKRVYPRIVTDVGAGTAED